MLWTKRLCALKICMLKPQHDGIWNWGLCEVIRVRWGHEDGPHNGINVDIRRNTRKLFSLFPICREETSCRPGVVQGKADITLQGKGSWILGTCAQNFKWQEVLNFHKLQNWLQKEPINSIISEQLMGPRWHVFHFSVLLQGFDRSRKRHYYVNYTILL